MKKEKSNWQEKKKEKRSLDSTRKKRKKLTTEEGFVWKYQKRKKKSSLVDSCHSIKIDKIGSLSKVELVESVVVKGSALTISVGLSYSIALRKEKEIENS